MNFTDRYKALGIPYPDTETMCGGNCEGIGRYPVESIMNENSDVNSFDDEEFYEEEQWTLEHNKGSLFQRLFHKIKCDGWDFIICRDCKGSGKK